MFALLLLCSSLASADTIRLQNGGSLEGVILKKDHDGVVILLKYATVTVGSFDIASVDATDRPPVPGARLAGWERCFRALVSRPWGAELHQMAARLIADGPLKNVPYVVHASGDFQIAIYGDPDRPAAIELGVSGPLRENVATRKEFAELLASFLARPADAENLRSVLINSAKKESEGLVFEATVEPDARGRETWWISASDPAALDSSRVSDKEAATLINSESPQSSSSPTLVQDPATGKGERQDVITPFGTEPHDPPHRKTYGGGGYWGGGVRWNHGHVTMPPPPPPPAPPKAPPAPPKK